MVGIAEWVFIRRVNISVNKSKIDPFKVTLNESGSLLFIEYIWIYKLIFEFEFMKIKVNSFYILKTNCYIKIYLKQTV